MKHYSLTKQGVFNEEEGSYIFQWKDLKRWAIHIPAGGIPAAFIMHPWDLSRSAEWIVLGVCCWIGFLIYEIRESKKVGDWDFKDIFGGLVSMIAIGIIIAIWC